MEREGSRLVLANSTFKGFELRLDPDIVKYSFMLRSVYEAGRLQIEQLAQEYPLESAAPGQATQEPKKQQQNHWPFDLQFAFNFFSGSVILYQSREKHEASPVRDRRRGSQAAAADNIKLPGISLWLRGEDLRRKANTPSGHNKTVQVFVVSYRRKIFATRRATLIYLLFLQVVHASENLLKPSILRFIDETRKEASSQSSSRRELGDAPTSAHAIGLSAKTDTSTAAEAAASLEDRLPDIRWEFALRIDQSRLRLTCMPDSPVLAGLAWQSGGLTAQYCPSRRRLAATIAVSGVSFDIRHEWLKDQECIAGRVTNMTGSLSWEKETPARQATLSAVIETEMSAETRLARIQDLLCFKAVWIDSLAPVSTSDPSEGKEDPHRIEPVASICAPHTARASTAKHLILFKIRRLELKADINISQICFTVEPVVVRLVKTAKEERIGGEIGHLAITANGVIAGKIFGDRIVLIAKRYPRDLIAQKAALLHLRIETGMLNAEIQHESQPFAYLQ